MQVESGAQYGWRRQGGGILDIPETQVRLGMLEKTEFQMFVPNYLLFHSPGQTNSGATHLSEVGLKQQLPRIKSIHSSLTASMNIPTGRNSFTGSGVQPVFRLPASIQIGKRYQLCAMLSFVLFNAGRSPGYQQTVMLNHTIGRKTIVFAEYAGFFMRGLPPINFAHFGAEYKITPRNQFDLHFGIGLNEAAPTAFLGGGYSFRIDKLCPSK